MENPAGDRRLLHSLPALQRAPDVMVHQEFGLLAFIDLRGTKVRRSNGAPGDLVKVVDLSGFKATESLRKKQLASGNPGAASS